MSSHPCFRLIGVVDDEVDLPGGKFPVALGNVAILEVDFVQHLFKYFFVGFLVCLFSRTVSHQFISRANEQLVRGNSFFYFGQFEN